MQMAEIINTLCPYVDLSGTGKNIEHTVKHRPEAHMDMILFEVFLKNIHLIPQDQIVQ